MGQLHLGGNVFLVQYFVLPIAGYEGREMRWLCKTSCFGVDRHASCLRNIIELNGSAETNYSIMSTSPCPPCATVEVEAVVVVLVLLVEPF